MITRELVQRLCNLSPEHRRLVLADLPAEVLELLAYEWEIWARPKQRLPAGEWTFWLIKAGRGFGKTRTGSETVRLWARSHRYVNVIGATADDARDIMVQGESGILAVCPRAERPEYKPSQRKLIWPNGAESLIFTADEPDRLRGKQHEKLWADELAAWRYAESWDQAKFGLRLGPRPQAIVTTTPRPTRLVRDLMADPSTVVTEGSTHENRANLAPQFLHQILRTYEGTRLGRQEIDGELLEDNPHAMFRRADIDGGRLQAAPTLTRVIVAVDPAATSSEGSDETGIVVVGRDAQGHCYVLADRSLKATPEGWGREAVKAYHEFGADRIVAETNNGGEMVESTLRVVDRNVAVKRVTASRGKAIRAEPVAALYEQRRVHHVGCFNRLEDQMVEWDPNDTSAKSPDRMDALVWGVTELAVNDGEPNFLAYLRMQVEANPALKAEFERRREAERREREARRPGGDGAPSAPP